MFDGLLDQTIDKDGNERSVYVDNAYRSDVQEQSNRTQPKVRVRVEHDFAAQAAMGVYLVHTIGTSNGRK